MSTQHRLRTEHAGAKRGRGYWGPKAIAKEFTRKLRRRRDRQLIEKGLREE